MPTTGPPGPKQAGPPTNRSKYEDKLLPATPKASSSSSTQGGPKRPHRIQPVTPLVGPQQDRYNTKDRAVTDPVIPQPPTVAKEQSLTKLQEPSKLNLEDKASDEEMPQENQQPSLPCAGSDDGSEVMHVYPVANNNQGELSSSAPPTTTNTPPPFSSFLEDQSTSTPVHPYRLREKNWPTPPLTYAALTSNPQMVGAGSGEKQGRLQGMIMGDGILQPTRTGGYAYRGQVGIVHPDDSQRVTSQVGVIETVEPPGASNTPGYPSRLEGTMSHLEGRKAKPKAIKQQPSINSVRSGSNYGGVWENHSQVGRSLPPFTSGSPRFPPNPETISHHRSISSRSATVPIMLDDFHGAHNLTSSQSPSVPYNNSWMPGLRGNPYASSNMPSAMNTPPPNAVPPPPSSYPGFQPSVQVPAGIERMETSLHQHLDKCFGNLTRLVTDKSDNNADQMTKRLESSEDKMDKALRGIKDEVRELKEEAAPRHQEVKVIMSKVNDNIREQVKVNDSIREQVKDVGLKIDALEKKLDEESDAELEMVVRQPDESTRRRTESAHATLGHNEQRRGGMIRSTNELGQGHQTSRGRQITTDHAGGSGARRDAGRSTRREHFAQVGVMRGEPPDLSQHPAYRRGQGQSPGHSQDVGRVAAGHQANGSTSYQTPSSQNGGWYHQAYGQ